MLDVQMKILVVADESSFLITSIVEKIKASGFVVSITKPEVNLLHGALKEVNGVLICVSEKMLDDSKALIYMRDTAIEEDIQVFLYGDKDVLESTDSIIGSKCLKDVFIRPIDVVQVCERIEKAMDDAPAKKQKKVLVVDDSGAMLRNVKEWLQDKYKVILANSGTMAIKYLATERPDLVLLDYEMPVLNGKQVLEMIRSEMEFSDIPVIFLTSKDDRQSVLDVMALKPQGYLLKTQPPAQIIATVDEFFAKQKKL